LLAGLTATALVGLTSLGHLHSGDAAPTAALPVAAVAPVPPTPIPPAPIPPPELAPPSPPARDTVRLQALLGDVWIHPLQGPSRRMPLRDSRLFGAERLGDRPTECRGGHCGIDLAGDYGESVFAVHDGVIDRVQRDLNPDRGGRYVRISHRGGTVMTEYFHLSAIPRRLQAGMSVKAGDVIGWVGLSGVKHSEAHLHFTVAVQDPDGSDGRYIDPEPLVSLWPLRVPGQSSEPLQLMTSEPAGLARGFAHHRHRHMRTIDSAPAD
jgi:murein DD-endopeptidase MepM/ murein hydrolase activator NlpD